MSHTEVVEIKKGVTKPQKLVFFIISKQMI